MAKGKKKEKAKKKDKSKKKKSDGGNGAQQFLMANGEKIGLGVVGVIVVLCLVAAISKETVSANLAPKRLETKAKAKLAEIIGHKPDPAPPSIYKSILTKSKGIKAEDFALTAMVTVPPGDLKGKRQEPVYLPPEDLQVVPGSGYIAFIGSADPDAGVKVEGDAGYEAVPGNQSVVEHYLVVTGLVPRKKQRIEFQKAFQETLGSKDDDKDDPYAPEYYRMIVERAEVTPGQSEDQLTWTIINEKSNKGLSNEVRDRPLDKLIMEDWADVLPEALEMLPPEFVEYYLVYVNTYDDFENWLPPLMLRNWTAGEVVHEKVRKALEDARSASPRKDPVDKKRGGRRDRDDDTGPGELDEEVLAAAADEFGYRMLRHFDFDVELGKEYRYRIRLVVSNPNDGFNDRFLSQEVLDARDAARKADGNNLFRTTPNSAPSAAVGLPSDLSVELVSVVVRTRAGEPTAQFEMAALGDVQAALAQAEKNLVRIRNSIRRKAAATALKTVAEQWNDVDKVWATGSFSVYRGAWLNLDGDDKVQVTNPLTRTEIPLPGFPFVSDHLLVDIRGGQAMDKVRNTTFTVPGEALMLDPTGKLIIRYEAGQGGGGGGGKAGGGNRTKKPAKDLGRNDSLLDELE